MDESHLRVARASVEEQSDSGRYVAKVVVAEWLRRWTWNPLGSPRAGSNPADYDKLTSSFALHKKCFFIIIAWQ